MVLTGSVTFFEREPIAALALKNRLPSMFSLREFVLAGGLMSYGESLFDFHHRAALRSRLRIAATIPSATPFSMLRFIGPIDAR
jgi:hypothetical protein